MKVHRCLMGIIICMALSTANAAPSPIALLQSISNQLMIQLEKKQTEIHHNPTVLNQIIHRVLIPHVNQTRMAQYVVGRQYWQRSTDVERSLFIQYFTDVLIRTYAHALKVYSSQKIKFYQRGHSHQRIVNVYASITPTQGPIFEVVYQMLYERGAWRIIDFSVDGVSLVHSYREQFAETLSQGGLKALVKVLKKSNLT
ncbi:MAG: hypothetical protein CMF51_03735 [Legionellales bacterium]|nr:hypothetical protein [Legionellales bacterium]